MFLSYGNIILNIMQKMLSGVPSPARALLVPILQCHTKHDLGCLHGRVEFLEWGKE